MGEAEVAGERPEIDLLSRFDVVVGPVAHGGHFVSRAPDGRVVFVRHALPGETVTVEVTEERAGYLRADTVQVKVAGPQRVVPPCRYAGRCGGCDFQHATPAYQRELKSQVLIEQLRRLGRLSPAQIEALDLTVRPLPGGALGWRTRVGFAVDAAGRAGLLAHRSHEVVPVRQCLIAAPPLQALGATTRRWPQADRIELVSGADDQVSVREVGRSGARAVTGTAEVIQRAGGRTWRLPPDAFWQVHPAAAEALLDAVCQLLQPVAGEVAWDLYGGVGLFSAALAERVGPAGSVALVDSDPVAVKAARANLADLDNVQVVQSRVESARLAGRPDLVVMDPPRSGAGAVVIHRVATAGPRVITYVACDPAGFARDVANLATHGFGLTHVLAFDAFPMTHHLECVGRFIPAG